MTTAIKWPQGVYRIISNEFMERFSFYGLRALLVLFLSEKLKLDDNTAVACFMYFGAGAYAFPIIGGYLADSFFGKYKTILIFSLVYASGSLLLAISSAVLKPWLTFVGLALIAVGTGGIKPCVSAFGADQFKRRVNAEDDDVKETQSTDRGVELVSPLHSPRATHDADGFSLVPSSSEWLDDYEDDDEGEVLLSGSPELGIKSFSNNAVPESVRRRATHMPTKQHLQSDAPTHVPHIKSKAPAHTHTLPNVPNKNVKTDETELSSYFAAFYLSINCGAILSYILTPALRVNFGYPAAFGAPVAGLLTATLLFWSGRKSYVIEPPAGSVLPRLLKLAVRKQRSKWEWCCGPEQVESKTSYDVLHIQTKQDQEIYINEQVIDHSGVHVKQHFELDLNNTTDESEYEKGCQHEHESNVNQEQHERDESNLVALGKVLRFLAVFPCFWMLYDQQGSAWTLQARQLNTHGIGWIQPETMLALNPICIVLLIPALHYCVFPCITRIRAPTITVQGESGESWWWRCCGCCREPVLSTVVDSDSETVDGIDNEAPIGPILEPVTEPIRTVLEPESELIDPTVRIQFGMFFTALAFVASALLQYQVDNSPEGTVSVFLQIPQIMIISIGEVLVSVTGLEYSYMLAPTDLKSTVSALYLLTTTVGDLLAGVLYQVLGSLGLGQTHVFLVFVALILCNMVALWGCESAR